MLNLLYPTGSSPSYGAKYTALMQSIQNDVLTPVDITDWAKPYYMGFVPYDVLPSHLKLSKINLDSGVLTTTEQTPRNHGWGFATAGSAGTAVYYVNSSSKIVKSSTMQASNSRFINSITMARYASPNYLRPYLLAMVIPKADLDSNLTAYHAQVSLPADGSYDNIGKYIDTTVTDFLAFASNDASLDFGNITINGATIALTFEGDDFRTTQNKDHPTCIREFSAGGTTYVLFAQLYAFYMGMSQSKYISASNVTGSPNIVPFFEYDCFSDSSEFNTSGKWVRIGADTGYPSYMYNAAMTVGIKDSAVYSVVPSTSGYAISNDNNIYWGDYHIIDGRMAGGSDPYWYAAVTTIHEPQSRTNGVIRGRHIIVGAYDGMYGQHQFMMYAYLSTDDILTALAFSHKIYTPASIPIPENQYTTDYTVQIYDDNKPTATRKSGTTADLYDDLMLWQRPDADITADDFDIDDMPIYAPDGDGTEDSGGDTIAPYNFSNTPLSAANNFTTLYALTTAQVAAFGSIMWASLSDPNFWHAVGVEFSNDFSINPADMMRYFNFLRYYPFDLTPYSSQYISGIYIGRSTIPIQFPAGMEYPRRASRNLIQIDGGEVTARLPAPYNSDDFFVSDPAVQIQAHIPFCGTVQLSAAECYGRTLYLNYVVDLQSGAIQATISVQADTYYIVATLAGTCGAGVQITANNNIEYLTRIATVATGGISSAATMATRGAQVAGAEGAAAAGVVGALTGTVSALAGLPPVTVHKQGSTTGFANYGGDPRAYITIQAPKRSIPDTYPNTTGFVSNKRARIGDLSGYTEMINPDLSGIAAHQDELAEIYRILQAGFFA